MQCRLWNDHTELIRGYIDDTRKSIEVHKPNTKRFCQFTLEKNTFVHFILVSQSRHESISCFDFSVQKGTTFSIGKKGWVQTIFTIQWVAKNFRPKFLVAKILGLEELIKRYRNWPILRQCPQFFQCFSVFYTKYCKNTWNQWNKWKKWHGKAEVFQAGIYLLKVNNRNSRTKYES